jgi:mono/diheme cytochrome c family protein
MPTALWISVATAALLGADPAPQRAADDAAAEFYEKRVRPILAANCYECHGDDQQESGLQVTSISAMLRGGDQGPAIVPGDSDASLLMKGVRWEDSNFQMPPKAKLSKEQIATLEKWIKDGALGPDERRVGAATTKKFDLAERAKHWCFQPVAAPSVPVVFDGAWSRDPLDRFVLARLEAANLPPAPEADPATLLRRVYFDLIGLPPDLSEIDEFTRQFSSSPALPVSHSAAKDRESERSGEREKAYEAVIDSLLASPHFGERWGRHWLDLVRYAETRGHEFDMLIPNAYQYRDYVIRALNADVPYDRFVVEHIAGDLLPKPRLGANGANESILGTGFWWLGEEVHSPVDIRQDETDRVDNKIDVLSKTFLGLTLACARCHDHKFDALSTKDYYALSGFVLSMSFRQVAFEVETHNRRIYDGVKRLEAENLATLLEAQTELWQPVLKQADQYLLAVRDATVELRAAGKKANRAAVVTATSNQYELDEQHLAAWIAASEAEPQGPLGPRGDELLKPAGMSTSEPPVGWKIVYDAANVSNREWFSDGPVFGDRPRRRGEVCIGLDAARPIDGLFASAGAASEPKWDVVRAVNGETDKNRLSWQQAGRTLKTPTFVLESGRLALLVQGSCNVYAEVDSHRVNAGPLHGALARRFPGDDQPRWIDFDLSAYRGEKVHLEFTPYDADELKPKQSSRLAVRGVVERSDATDAPPTWYFDPLPTASDFATLAPSGTWAEAFRGAAAALADAKKRPPSAAATFTVQWMLRHPELWNTPSDEVAAKVSPFFETQAALFAQLKTVSHTAPCAWDGDGLDEHVLVRGQHKLPGDLVPRRFLEALDGSQAPKYATNSGRLELAERIVDEQNPLAARVIVNRVWYHLFGRGIVRTVDNFGMMGDAPTHPELLDHLAREFMNDGWSVKRLIRRLVLSTTYRQSSESRTMELANRNDPKNDLFHRANVKRLDAEIIRDALLAVSGRLDEKLYGPSVEAYFTSFMEGRGRPGKSGPLDGDGRRSIYLKVRRNFLNPMFQAFDYPTPFTTIGRRTSSNVPAQALSLLNGELVNQQAALWATRVLRETPGDAEARIDQLYREAFARLPSNDERSAAVEFLKLQQTSYGANNADDLRAWTDLCHVLFNVKEFIYIP